MDAVQLVVALLIILVALVALAFRLKISYPIILVLGGLVLAIPPRLPSVRLEPDLVFLVFLPPLLFADAINSSWRDFRENWRPIFLLSVGLVFATAGSVMIAAHFLLHIAWGPAFVLGAVLGPTDTVAVSAILERFKIPRRMTAILRGESLVNDATALVLFEAAIRTTQMKSYIWGSVVGGFCLAVVGGVGIGCLVGWIVAQLRRHTADPILANTISLLAGFAAYQPAATLHFSGVLAVVTAGLYLGWNDPWISTARSRIQATGTWEMLTFLLNGLLFILIGLQLRTVGEPLWSQDPWFLLMGSVIVSAAVIGARMAWVFLSTYLPRLFRRRASPSDHAFARRQATLLSWVGIRGGISLAAALAIPPTLADGSLFPQRNEVLIFTFAVILTTLVVQGLTLPGLLRWLHFDEEPAIQEEENKTRLAMAVAALDYLQTVERTDEFEGKAIDHLSELYRETLRLPIERGTAATGGRSVTVLGRLVGLERAIVNEQRSKLIQLRDTDEISDEILRRFQSLLDLRESELNSPEARSDDK